MARHAWIIFFLLGLGAVVAAPIGVVGLPPDPPSPKAMTGLTRDEISAGVPGMRSYIGSIACQRGNFMRATGVLMAAVAQARSGGANDGPGTRCGPRRCS